MSRIFSGVQPTAEAAHLGNYTGAFRQWVALQEQHESFICIVDLHSMTVAWDPEELRTSSRAIAATLLACGIDPERSALFLQSDVSEHTELAWVLTCLARMGELSRMTQFKDKSKGSSGSSVSSGLFMYPVLMAADVLAYRADLVPVGDDQRQHLELMRELAERFNRQFGETFPVPEAHVPESGARIMNLDDPTQKMAKSSDRPGGNLWMTDPPEVIRKKIARAVTDSGRDIAYGADKPAISNLLDIFAGVTGTPAPELAEQFAGSGYAELKAAMTDAVVAFLEPFQQRMSTFAKDPAQLDALLDRGAERARAEAADTMTVVRERVGLRRR